MSKTLVVVDDGFRQIKLLTPERRWSQLSVAREGATLGLELADDVRCGAYRSEGRDYTVDAGIDGEDTRFDDYALSAINRVLVWHALYANGLAGQDIVLATGLPFQTYYVAGTATADKALIERKQANLAVPVEAIGGAPPPRIAGQFVLAQGLSAYVDWALDDELKLRPEVDQNAPVTVIDVGGRTTDTATIVRGSTVDHSASGTVNLGVSNIQDRLAQLLTQRFKVNSIRASLLDSALRRRTVSLWGQTHDISREVEAAIDAVLPQVLRELQRRVGSAAEMQAVLLVGGGAHLLAAGLKKHYPHLVVSEDPEFANARGMLKTLRGLHV